MLHAKYSVFCLFYYTLDNGYFVIYFVPNVFLNSYIELRITISLFEGENMQVIFVWKKWEVGQ